MGSLGDGVMACGTVIIGSFFLTLISLPENEVMALIIAIIFLSASSHYVLKFVKGKERMED